MRLAELRPHLFTLPQHPDWIPYRTSYYRESWGFCLSEQQLGTLPDDVYDVCIDSSLEEGSLTYGECYLPGASEEEVLVSCHICHPSLCNDNLSGIAVAVTVAQALGARGRRYSYRFLFLPGTIGAIAWLALNERRVSRIKHGLVLVCVGDAGASTRSEEHTSELQSLAYLVCRLLLEKKKTKYRFNEANVMIKGPNCPDKHLYAT